MPDEPGSPSPPADPAGASVMLDLVSALTVPGAEGDARVKAILGRIEAKTPGSIARLSAGLALRRVAWRDQTLQ